MTDKSGIGDLGSGIGERGSGIGERGSGIGERGSGIGEPGSGISATEQLVQRFVDQDLSAEERMKFVLALGRDAALRARVLELERLMLDASSLPRPGVPDGFIDRVMERTGVGVQADHERGFWQRLATALWAPRALHWNLATAAALGCLALLVVGGGVSQALRWRALARADAPASAGAPDGAVVLVRLVVVQPGAKIVQAAGDFNGWNPSQTPLEQTSDGAWTVTLPLEPGRYEYQFVVDGEQWIGDPFAAEQNDDGFGSQNAVLDVRPPADTL